MSAACAAASSRKKRATQLNTMSGQQGSHEDDDNVNMKKITHHRNAVGRGVVVAEVFEVDSR